MNEGWSKSRWWKAVAPLLVWGIVLLLPTPAGLETQAWHYFGLFLAVIVGLVLEPIPSAAVGFIGVTLAMVFGYVRSEPGEAIRWGISGFSNSTVWLIFGAFMLSLGYSRSGLGRRIGLTLVRKLGSRTLGLAYAIALADLALAPVTPSNTARSGGTTYPIISNIPGLYGSAPGPTARKIGAYIMWTGFAVTGVTSSMFLTALAPNPLSLSFVEEITGIQISWGQWFLGFLPVGVLLFLGLPLLVYVLYPPEIKESADVPDWASRQLEELGGMARSEIVMTGLVLFALGFWIFGGEWIHTTTVVWVVISLMVLTKIVGWEEILSHGKAWNILVWFATLVALASGLNEVGFLDWAAQNAAGLLEGYSALTVMVGLVVFFYVAHYLFASLTAHTTALLPVLLSIGVAMDEIPLMPFVLLLCYSVGLMGVITPYATGPGPVYYGSGYITPGEFWKLGLTFGSLYVLALLLIGLPYLLPIL